MLVVVTQSPATGRPEKLPKSNGNAIGEVRVINGDCGDDGSWVWPHMEDLD